MKQFDQELWIDLGVGVERSYLPGQAQGRWPVGGEDGGGELPERRWDAAGRGGGWRSWRNTGEGPPPPARAALRALIQRRAIAPAIARTRSSAASNEQASISYPC